MACRGRQNTNESCQLKIFNSVSPNSGGKHKGLHDSSLFNMHISQISSMTPCIDHGNSRDRLICTCGSWKI